MAEPQEPSVPVRDEFSRPPTYGQPAGAAQVEAVLKGQKPPPRPDRSAGARS